MEVEQGGVAVPRFRYEPVSARLSLAGWLDVDVGVGFEQAVDAVEIRAALGDGVAQAKGVIELGSEEECSVFNQKWPFTISSIASAISIVTAPPIIFAIPLNGIL